MKLICLELDGVGLDFGGYVAAIFGFWGREKGKYKTTINALMHSFL
jgi:hypothetical protein